VTKTILKITDEIFELSVKYIQKRKLRANSSKLGLAPHKEKKGVW
jgi:hypothetical protein